MSDAPDDTPATPDLTDYIANSPVLKWLQDNGHELTRRNYIAMATFGHEDYDWDEEDEAGMPEPLRDYAALAEEMAERELASAAEPDEDEDDEEA